MEIEGMGGVDLGPALVYSEYLAPRKTERPGAGEGWEAVEEVEAYRRALARDESGQTLDILA